MEKNLNHFYIPETNTTLRNILLQLNNKNKKCLVKQSSSSISLSNIQNALTLQLSILIMFYNLPIPPCSPHLKSSLNIPC